MVGCGRMTNNINSDCDCECESDYTEMEWNASIHTYIYTKQMKQNSSR